MNSVILWYILVFILGGMTASFVLSMSEYNTGAALKQAGDINDKTTDANLPISGTENIRPDDAEKNENQELYCDDQLEEKLNQLKQTDTQLNKSVKDQNNELARENAVLKLRLAALEPSSVDDEELKKLIPAPHNQSLTMLPDKFKQEIVDLHQQENDPDWGYIKQQQLTDFITTHVNFEFVNLTSIMCKINQCEVIIDEKINPESMAQQGMNSDDIQTLIDTQEPKYKVIFDEIRINPELNLVTGVYMPNRFGIYMQLKDKSAMN